jgi:hypothetical protein
MPWIYCTFWPVSILLQKIEVSNLTPLSSHLGSSLNANFKADPRKVTSGSQSREQHFLEVICMCSQG